MTQVAVVVLPVALHTMLTAVVIVDVAAIAVAQAVADAVVAIKPFSLPVLLSILYLFS